MLFDIFLIFYGMALRNKAQEALWKEIIKIIQIPYESFSYASHGELPNLICLSFRQMNQKFSVFQQHLSFSLTIALVSLSFHISPKFY